MNANITEELSLTAVKKTANFEHVFRGKGKFPFNERVQDDGLILLSAIQEEKIKTCFFDPQYRGVLDKLNYGNEGERQKGRALLKQMDSEIITSFCKEINRVLLPSGYLFLWVDKYHLMNNDFTTWFCNTQLNVVDMITWDKGRMGMGYRSRRQCEYLAVIQRKPVKSKGTWSIKNIRDIWMEKIDSKKHPHQKPYELQKKLIECVTNEGDLVGDFAAGSFSVLEACKEINRTFIGCDLYVD